MSDPNKSINISPETFKDLKDLEARYLMYAMECKEEGPDRHEDLIDFLGMANGVYMAIQIIEGKYDLKTGKFKQSK